MATSSDDARDKTVTGYPAPPGQYAAGYPGAYPYAAPAPQINNNTYPPMGPPPYYNPQQAGYVRSKPTILCRVLIAGVAVFTIMSVVFFIAWLTLRPRLPEFRVESATVFPLNATGSQLTATWDVNLLAVNPNHKLSIYYDTLRALLFFGYDSQLTTTQLPPFVLSKRNQTSLGFTLTMREQYVGNKVAKGISDGKDRRSVSFGLGVLAEVRFRSGVFRSRTRLMRVYCDPVNFGFTQNNGTGTLTGGSKPCEVDL